MSNWAANTYVSCTSSELVPVAIPDTLTVSTHTLYGLKQVGLAWWNTLRESMIELGFEGLVSDAGLFVYRDEHCFVIAVIYVDDAIFCGPNKALVKQLKDKFMQR